MKFGIAVVLVASLLLTARLGGAAPFGIEFFVSPGDGVEDLQAETYDDFSVYLAHSHGAYGSGTFYFDATVTWDPAALTLVRSEWVQPRRAGSPAPYTATPLLGEALFDVDWFIDDDADGDELIRLDFAVLRAATTGVEVIDVAVPNVSLTISSPVPKVYDYSGPDGSLGVPITAVAYAPGDYDLDGAVDTADYTAWAQAYGSTTKPAIDGVVDGVIDAADYTVWRDALPPPTATPTPEPSTAAMLIGLAAIASLWGSGRSSRAEA